MIPIHLRSSCQCDMGYDHAAKIRKTKMKKSGCAVSTAQSFTSCGILRVIEILPECSYSARTEISGNDWACT